MMPPATEREVLAACLRLLALYRIPAFRVNSGVARALNRDGTSRYVRFNSADGCSDLIGLIPSQGGRLLACEVKRPGGKLRDNQAVFLDAVRQNGGLSLCVSDVKELETALQMEGIIP